MKCPKCEGTLLVMSTPNVKGLDVKGLDSEDCIDVNLECSKDGKHIFFTRIHGEDLLESN